MNGQYDKAIIVVPDVKLYRCGLCCMTDWKEHDGTVKNFQKAYTWLIYCIFTTTVFVSIVMFVPCKYQTIFPAWKSRDIVADSLRNNDGLQFFVDLSKYYINEHWIHSITGSTMPCVFKSQNKVTYSSYLLDAIWVKQEVFGIHSPT